MLPDTKMQKHEDATSLSTRGASDLFSRWESEFDRMIESLWYRPFPSFWGPARWWPDRTGSMPMPFVDVLEEKDDVIVTAELPGLSKDEIDVNINGSTLTIKGERKKDEVTNGGDYLTYFRKERRHGAFSRSLELPTEFKADQVKASFKDGILQIRLPKTEESKKKTVNIKVV